MSQVRIYTTSNCPYCIRAKSLFKRLEVPFDEIDLEGNPELRAKLSHENNWRTVPMIFIGERFVGGFDDVSELHRSGELKTLLAS